MATKIQKGTMLSEVFFPNIAYIFKNANLDFFVLDCEHGAFDYSQASAIISLARALGIETIVRIPEIRREYVTKYLDMGANSLLIPMLQNAADAHTIIDLAHYAPKGNRGISISRSHSKYDPGDVKKYMEDANNKVKIYGQIELVSALNEVEKIAATNGLDGLFVGPSDLSSALGVFGNFSCETFTSAVTRILAATRASGKSCGVITTDIPLIKFCVQNGADMVCSGSELRILTQGFKKISMEIDNI